MSIEVKHFPRMPQPEQWMSEHPFWTWVIFAVVFAVVVVVRGVWG